MNRWILLLLLLLLSLSCCFCEIRIKVNVTPKSSKGEENDHVSGDWKFESKPGESLSAVLQHCEKFPREKVSVVLHLHAGEDVSAKDGEFNGPLDCDKVNLPEGIISLSVTSAQTGRRYQCDIITKYSESKGRCILDVTAAENQIRSEEKPAEAADQTWKEVFSKVCLTTGLAAVVFAFYLRFFHWLTTKPDKKRS